MSPSPAPRLPSSPLDPDKLHHLVHSIKQKKELQDLSDEFVIDQLALHLRKEPKLARQLSQSWNPRSAAYRQVVKKIRASLRRVHGLFWEKHAKTERRLLLNKLQQSSPAQQRKIILGLLATHSSTKERLPLYPKLYQKIFRMTGQPYTILDVGCGLNPLSIPFMKLPRMQYYAYDISDEEISLLREFFSFLHHQQPGFVGHASVLNVLDIQRLQHLPRADLCLLFKMTDILDQGKGHRMTEKVIEAIPASFVAVSFSTLTMSGKPMTAPRRRWMEWLCRRRGWGYTVLEFENEIVYVVKK